MRPPFVSDRGSSHLPECRRAWQRHFLGRRQCEHVRVGLEDNLYLGKGELAPSNADQVRKIRRILEKLSLIVATPDEARVMLLTKGTDNTAF
ncbi:3-keto-5-aminohexanoate cleavage protein [Neorhizobium galegae]|uniref:3-keto-5-aminohexanoate cleavage protein n=1 Tax=Neorhizobium galegae TaxID=399 RepID=UPI0009BA65AB|nr:3-keto-5-aminohexanoate cleavage protein [Neorhizobium galegae]KAB1110128.1 3-keto-5-aminohexanoate cleavage protein [Neorhizobium galegae]